MDALSNRNSELTAELEKLASEKEDFASVFKNCGETLNNQVLRIRTTRDSLELLLEAGSQMNFELEEEIKRVNVSSDLSFMQEGLINLTRIKHISCF